MEFQGKVLHKQSDSYAVMLFSFLDGRATSIRLFPISVIEKSTFYDSQAEWLAAADYFLKAMNQRG